MNLRRTPLIGALPAAMLIAMGLSAAPALAVTQGTDTGQVADIVVSAVAADGSLTTGTTAQPSKNVTYTGLPQGTAVTATQLYKVDPGTPTTTTDDFYAYCVEPTLAAFDMTADTLSKKDDSLTPVPWGTLARQDGVAPTLTADQQSRIAAILLASPTSADGKSEQASFTSLGGNAGTATTALTPAQQIQIVRDATQAAIYQVTNGLTPSGYTLEGAGSTVAKTAFDVIYKKLAETAAGYTAPATPVLSPASVSGLSDGSFIGPVTLSGPAGTTWKYEPVTGATVKSVATDTTVLPGNGSLQTASSQQTFGASVTPGTPDGAVTITATSPASTYTLGEVWDANRASTSTDKPAQSLVAATRSTSAEVTAAATTAPGTTASAQLSWATPPQQIVIGDTVFWDVNRNGNQDQGETSAPAKGTVVTLSLVDKDGQPLKDGIQVWSANEGKFVDAQAADLTQAVGEDGKYSFTVPTRTDGARYVVAVSAPTGKKLDVTTLSSYEVESAAPEGMTLEDWTKANLAKDFGVNDVLPTLDTLAEDADNADLDNNLKTVKLEGMIKDTLTHTGLTPGADYIVRGRLVNAATGAQLGSDVIALYIPETADGSTTMTFTADTKLTANLDVVVYESLYRLPDLRSAGYAITKDAEGKLKDFDWSTVQWDALLADNTTPKLVSVVKHEDKTDKDQTVHVTDKRSCNDLGIKNIKKGEQLYRADLDPDKNDVICESTPSTPSNAGRGTAGSGGSGSTGGGSGSNAGGGGGGYAPYASNGSLAKTGFEAPEVAGAAAVAIAIGSGLVVAARRRRETATGEPGQG